MSSEEREATNCSLANVENTLDNNGWEKESVTIDGSERSRCAEENGQSEHEKRLAIEGHVNSGPCGTTIEHSDEILQSDAVRCHNGVMEAEDVEKVSDNFHSSNDNRSPTANNETVAIIDETVAETANSHQSNEQCSVSSTEIEEVQSRQEMPLVEQKGEPNATAEPAKQIGESTTVSATIADDDTEIDGDASNDENELSANEHDSNEDSSEFPDLSDCDATNEPDNDEYILDTVVRKRGKERRRIVAVNDDDDSDREMERERERLLQQSPTTIGDSELRDVSGVEEEDIEQLIRNEKPGPKSKKMSTQKLKELQTRELLRNAVVIPSSGKKRKSRIIDSDDEFDSLLPYCVNVDDIGLPDMTEENDNDTDVLLGNSILLNDIDKPEPDPSASIEVSADANNTHEITVTAVQPVTQTDPENVECSSHQEPTEAAPELVIAKSPSDATTSETPSLTDSGNGTDGIRQQCEKGNETHSGMTADFPPFASSTSSDGEDEFIPNDVYFGTPDINKRGYVRDGGVQLRFKSISLSFFLSLLSFSLSTRKCFSSARGKGGGRSRRGRPSQFSSREKPTTQNAAQSAKKASAPSGRKQPQRQEKFIDNGRWVLSARRSIAKRAHWTVLFSELPPPLLPCRRRRPVNRRTSIKSPRPDEKPIR